LETFAFLPVNGEKIFTITHRPETRRHPAGVLMLHAFAEEKLWTQRASAQLARALAAAGLPVLRFDHRGHGDSDREHREMTLESMLEDLDAAAAALRAAEDVQELHLFGFRLGATLALSRAEALGASSVALVNPVARGGDFLMKALRSNLTTQMGIYGEVRADRDTLLAEMRETGLVNIDGYHLSATCFDALSGLTVEDARFAGPGLALSLVRREGAPADADTRRVFARFESHAASRLETLVHPQVWGEQKRYATGDAALFDPLVAWFTGGWRGAT
jgi:pimeloyl-ACP methyl ester carboxylesterase